MIEIKAVQLANAIAKKAVLFGYHELAVRGTLRAYVINGRVDPAGQLKDSNRATIR